MPKSQQVTIWLPAPCLAHMAEQGESSMPKETGGVLMGYWASHNGVVITHIIGPGPNARHGRYSFHPDVEFHDREIARVYRDSGRISTYLGDWHTHPHGGNSMSQRDRKTLMNIACAPEARAATPLMAILSVEKNLSLAVWKWQRKHLLWYSKVAACDVVVFE
jgi:integrative and conjugative element protein (TIGR02256 family)